MLITALISENILIRKTKKYIWYLQVKPLLWDPVYSPLFTFFIKKVSEKGFFPSLPLKKLNSGTVWGKNNSFWFSQFNILGKLSLIKIKIKTITGDVYFCY